MANITEKIERQITALEGKIDALSGNYLTNTWKRQREQQERDRKKGNVSLADSGIAVFETEIGNRYADAA